MAFCPNCGKAVTEQASKCLSCGQELEPRAGAKSARFKGTMMMTPASSAVQPPAASTATPAAAPAAAKSQPQPTAAAPAARATSPGPSKVAKATMLGTGGMGLAPPPAAAGSAHAAHAPPAAGSALPAGIAPPVVSERAPDSQAAAVTEPAPAPTPAAAGHVAAAGAPAVSAQAEREDSQRFLVGDPMAPVQAAHSARRAHRDTDEPAIPAQRTGLVVTIGVVGMVLIAAVGYFTARFMGLIH